MFVSNGTAPRGNPPVEKGAIFPPGRNIHRTRKFVKKAWIVQGPLKTGAFYRIIDCKLLNLSNLGVSKKERMFSMRIVMTIVGVDKVGIIAKASTLLAENNVNILNINQNIDNGFFNMVLIGDLDNAKVSVQDLKDKAAALGKSLGVEIRVQSEQIFTAMHRI